MREGPTLRGMGDDSFFGHGGLRPDRPDRKFVQHTSTGMRIFWDESGIADPMGRSDPAYGAWMAEQVPHTPGRHLAPGSSNAHAHHAAAVPGHQGAPFAHSAVPFHHHQGPAQADAPQRLPPRLFSQQAYLSAVPEGWSGLMGHPVDNTTSGACGGHTTAAARNECGGPGRPQPNAFGGGAGCLPGSPTAQMGVNCMAAGGRQTYPSPACTNHSASPVMPGSGGNAEADGRPGAAAGCRYAYPDSGDNACHSNRSDGVGGERHQPVAAAPKPHRTRSCAQLMSEVKDAAASQAAAAADGFKAGPFNFSCPALEQDIKNAASNPFKAGGGWGTVKGKSGNTLVANAVRGERRTWMCHHRGMQHSHATQCKWEIGYEITTEGWCCYMYKGSHNHLLTRSEAESMAQGSSARCIDIQLCEQGELMQQCGHPPSEIYRLLQARAADLQIPSRFTVGDVANRFPLSSSTMDFDATGLVEFLNSRERTLDLRYFITTDLSSKVDKVFVQLEGSLEEWVAGGDSNVLLFDPTHGTNKYGMKLCCFCTISSLGQTVILAFALLKFEDTSHIAWAFRSFMSVFKIPPLCLFTDGAGVIESAFTSCAAVFGNCEHLLCVFHISKNFYQHIHPILQVILLPLLNIHPYPPPGAIRFGHSLPDAALCECLLDCRTLSAHLSHLLGLFWPVSS